MAGCSGYVTYAMGGTEVTIAFSNPSAGRNKFGVGITGKEVSDHGYDSFVVLLTVADKKLLFRCKCTGSSTNECTVNIESGTLSNSAGSVLVWRRRRIKGRLRQTKFVQPDAL